MTRGREPLLTPWLWAYTTALVGVGVLLLLVGQARFGLTMLLVPVVYLPLRYWQRARRRKEG